MDAWSFPAVFVAAVAVAVGVSFWLIRAAAGAQQAPELDCIVCGRALRLQAAKEWRYCPYCGAPRGAKALHEILQRAPGDTQRRS